MVPRLLSWRPAQRGGGLPARPSPGVAALEAVHEFAAAHWALHGEPLNVPAPITLRLLVNVAVCALGAASDTESSRGRVSAWQRADGHPPQPGAAMHHRRRCWGRWGVHQSLHRGVGPGCATQAPASCVQSSPLVADEATLPGAGHGAAARAAAHSTELDAQPAHAGAGVLQSSHPERSRVRRGAGVPLACNMLTRTGAVCCPLLSTEVCSDPTSWAAAVPALGQRLCLPWGRAHLRAVDRQGHASIARL